MVDPKPGERLETLRREIDARRVVELNYRDAAGQATLRRVWPLGIFFWGDAWSLGAWCELRGDFRKFRLDRVTRLAVLDEPYPDESGRRLPD